MGARNFEMDAYLGAYQYDKAALWLESTRYISPSLLQHIKNKAVPKPGEYKGEDPEKIKELDKLIEKLASIEEGDTIKDSKSKPLSEEAYNQRLKTLLSNPIVRENFDDSFIPVVFSEIPEKPNFLNLTGIEVAKFYMDRTPAIKNVVEKRYKGEFKDFLGEFQIAFVLFMVGENMEAFDQWKKMFYAVCNSETYTSENIPFYLMAIRCIFNMIKQFPTDFFYDVLSRENFLKKSLGTFAEIIGASKNEKLKNRFGILTQLLETQFKIDIVAGQEEEEEAMEDEYSPVVVDDPEDYIF